MNWKGFCLFYCSLKHHSKWYFFTLGILHSNSHDDFFTLIILNHKVLGYGQFWGCFVLFCLGVFCLFFFTNNSSFGGSIFHDSDSGTPKATSINKNLFFIDGKSANKKQLCQQYHKQVTSGLNDNKLRPGYVRLFVVQCCHLVVSVNYFTCTWNKN